jgi:hypothetical protein
VDSAGVRARADASWNPLRCDGTTLPPGWLLAAKLLAFAVFRGQQFLGAGPPFLPFVPALDSLWFAMWLAPVTAAVFYGAFVCLMVNRVVQPACLVIAGCVLVHVAAHRLLYANNLMFACVFLLLVGLYDARTGLWPLRIQLALVYGGASLNKALDPDWWNGRFFDTLMIDALGVQWYAALAARLPERALGMFGGIGAMVVEATICSAVLASRNGRLGVSLMLVFHIAMLISTRGQLSLPFTYASLAVSAAFFYSQRPAAAPWIVPATWWMAALFIRSIPNVLRLI